ncbi:50S ribosomal protein L2 [Candidatus Woesearchaeota archaeon]|nr:50S ribosomal protein L2 [Candidatus Woesearchaeota archaeon]
MGKNLIQQARGKGSTTYRAPSHRFKAKPGYKQVAEDKKVVGRIIDILHCPAHTAPMIQIRYDDATITYNMAPEGIKVGDTVEIGTETVLAAGNTMSLKSIPEGTMIFNIESQPGDGGKFVRSSGTAARILTKMENKIIVVLPSKKKKEFHPLCKATIGVVAGGGRPEKPFIKAGNHYHKMRAKNKLYPRVCGISQNAVDHPFGGKHSSKKGRPTIAPRFAPPGRKVGKLKPRRTGMKR